MQPLWFKCILVSIFYKFMNIFQCVHNDFSTEFWSTLFILLSLFSAVIFCYLSLPSLLLLAQCKQCHCPIVINVRIFWSELTSSLSFLPFAFPYFSPFLPLCCLCSTDLWLDRPLSPSSHSSLPPSPFHHIFLPPYVHYFFIFSPLSNPALLFGVVTTLNSSYLIPVCWHLFKEQRGGGEGGVMSAVDCWTLKWMT